MTLPPTLRAYQDCDELFQRAVTDPKGCRACAGTYEAAVSLRTRMHYYRKLDREANARTYPNDHPMHGQSIFDDFAVRIIPDEDGQYWLYIEPHKAKILAVEGLSEVGDLIDSTSEEIYTIEDHSNG